MIEFLQLAFENFMAFREKQAVDLSKPGFYLIEGVNEAESAYKASNGAGKSTIQDALAWCLFGRPVRDLPYTDDVVSEGADGCEVFVRFQKSGPTYTVLRRRSSSGKASLTLTTVSQGVMDDLTKGTTKDTQEKIEQILEMGWKEFCSAVVFGGSSAHKFSSLSNKERMDVLNKATGADLYATASIKAAAERKAKAAEAFLTEQALKRTQDRLSLLRGNLRQARESLANASEVSSLSAKEKDEMRDIQAYLSGAEDVAVAWEKAVSRARDAEEKAHEMSREHTALSKQIEAMERKVQALTDEKKCPLCGSTKFDSAEVRSRLTEELVSLRSRRSMIHPTELLNTAKKLDEEARKLRGPVDLLQKRARRLEELKLKAEAAKKASQKERFEKEVERLRGETSAARLAGEELEKKLEELRQEEKLYAFLEKAFSPGLTSSVIEGAVPELNRRAAEVAEDLADGNVSVTFGTVGSTKGGKEVDRLDLVVSNEAGGKSYGASSGGEKAVVDLVAGAAIQSQIAGNARCNVAFYDEVLDHLDEVAGTRALLSLKKQAKEKAVFLVSHASWVKDVVQFDMILRVVKTPETSHLELELPRWAPASRGKGR